MLKKTYSLFLIVAIISISVGFVHGKSTGTWADVKALVGDEIAIKPKRGKKIFGILQMADDKELKIGVVSKMRGTPLPTVFKRSDIKSVWKAKLYSSRKSLARTWAKQGGTLGAIVGGVFGALFGADRGKPIRGAIIGSAVVGTISAISSAKYGSKHYYEHHKKLGLVFRAK